MIVFEDMPISPERNTEDNMRVIKSYMGDLVDKLNMLSEQVEDQRKRLEQIESEEE